MKYHRVYADGAVYLENRNGCTYAKCNNHIKTIYKLTILNILRYINEAPCFAVSGQNKLLLNSKHGHFEEHCVLRNIDPRK